MSDSGGPGLDFPTGWARTRWASVVRTALQDLAIVPLVHLLAPGPRRGTAELRRLDGPVVIASNHQSHADTSLVLAALPRRLRRRLVVAAAVDTFYNNRRNAIFASLVYNAIPIERLKVNRRSADLARELLEDGWAVLIYPEGGRSSDGVLREFKGGAAYLSERTGVPVLPCYLQDARRVLPRLFAKVMPESNGSKALRTHVSVTFGPLIDPAEHRSIRTLNTAIHDAVADLGANVAMDPLCPQPGSAPLDTGAGKAGDVTPGPEGP